METPYTAKIRKLDKQNYQFDQPFQSEPSMFSGENPYAAPVEESSSPVEESMMERVTAPSVDFSKDTLGEQAPAKTEAGQILGAGSDALIMFGDPSMKAVGLGLKAAQGITEAKRQREMDKYAAEVKKVQARQESLNRLSQIGQGMKV
jgi:hypothetical protein